MIAGGLDLAKLAVVGIVSADASLHQPDFRAAERTTSSCARSRPRWTGGPRGAHRRADHRHRRARDHPRGQARLRLLRPRRGSTRMEHGYPPYRRLLRVVWEDEDESRVQEASARAAAVLRGGAAGARRGAEGLDRRPRRWPCSGAATAAISCSRRSSPVRASAAPARSSRTSRPSARTAIDVDPVSMM